MKHYFYNTFAYSTIEEHLFVAKYAIDTQKSSERNSCYGMPAFVLLSSVIDIIGTVYSNGLFKSITKEQVAKKNGLGYCREHFEDYYNKFIKDIGLCSEKEFIDCFYNQSRCLATHNGIIGLTVCLTIKESPDGCFIKKVGKKTTIYLKQLYSIVNESYEVMKKESGLLPPQDIFGPTTGNTIDN